MKDILWYLVQHLPVNTNRKSQRQIWTRHLWGPWRQLPSLELQWLPIWSSQMSQLASLPKVNNTGLWKKIQFSLDSVNTKIFDVWLLSEPLSMKSDPYWNFLDMKLNPPWYNIRSNVYKILFPNKFLHLYEIFLLWNVNHFHVIFFQELAIMYIYKFLYATYRVFLWWDN